MGTYKFKGNVNKEKIFIISKSKISDRIDPDMIKYNREISHFKFPLISLGRLLIKSPQYGANEAGIERKDIKIARYIRITDINNYGLLSNKLGKTASKIEEQYFLKNNDILFARSGNTVGKSYIHKEKNINYKCFFAGYMIRFIVDTTKIIPDYLFLYTQLSPYKKWVKAIQRTAGQPNINAEEYKSLKIPLPPITIQQKIVEKYQKIYNQKQQKEQEAKEILDSIDTYLIRELGITLPEKDNSLKSRIFSINFSEISGLRIDPDYVSKYGYLISQKSKYPFTQFKNLLSQDPQYGANEEALKRKSNEDIRYIRITDIDELGNLKRKGWKTALNTDERYLLNKNDLLFARSGSVGKSYIHKETEKDAIFAGYLIRFVLDLKKSNPDFIFYYCNSTIYKFWVSAIERPAVQSNINSEEFKSMPIPLPPLEKQNEIANHISNLRAQAKQLQEEAKSGLELVKQEIEQLMLGNK